MWSKLRANPTNLFRFIDQSYQSKRTTYILRRTRGIRLNKLSQVCPKMLKKKNFYYEQVEDTDSKPGPLIELVLTENVPGVGMRGDKVEMNCYKAYIDLLLPKLALQADQPEAQGIVKNIEERQFSSKYTRIVQNYLASHGVKIILNNDIEWTLQPWHIKLALRKIGVIVNEDCIKIPKPISGPNWEIENKDFVVHITMNKTEVFPVRCRIYHWSTSEPSLNQKSFDVDSPGDVLFLDEKETIESLIKTQKEIIKSKMIKDEKPDKEIDEKERAQTFEY